MERLRIYTALKHRSRSICRYIVSIPSEFTLLSNKCPGNLYQKEVSIPSEFTLLSNTVVEVSAVTLFQYPLNLHCSQTLARCNSDALGFQYPLNLHCSQTP